jgi:hypothetical protein
MNLSDEALLEDSPEILAAVQEAISNLLHTKPRDKYIKCYEMFFSWRAQKILKTVNEKIIPIGIFFWKR